MDIKKHLDYTPEVADALMNKKPIVALESTIISHGLPYPENLELAKKVQEIVRANGATPATMAVIDGKLKIGMTDSELENFAKNGKNIRKASRRDLAILVSKKIDGATTVATTMMLAQFAGIPVLATGGIGGVHRGAETTMDISADLEELAVTPVMVVCAGAKSLLDIGLTLEYLETKGVPVIGYGTDVFPEFYTRGGGFGVDQRLDTPKDVADVYLTKEELGIESGMLVANPIPEQHAMEHGFITAAVEKALKDAKDQGIKGKDTTPFLLHEIHQTTGNKSLEANLELVYSNVEVATKIAVELSNR